MGSQPKCSQPNSLIFKRSEYGKWYILAIIPCLLPVTIYILRDTVMSIFLYLFYIEYNKNLHVWLHTHVGKLLMLKTCDKASCWKHRIHLSSRLNNCQKEFSKQAPNKNCWSSENYRPTGPHYHLINRAFWEVIRRIHFTLPKFCCINSQNTSSNPKYQRFLY